MNDDPLSLRRSTLLMMAMEQLRDAFERTMASDYRAGEVADINRLASALMKAVKDDIRPPSLAVIAAWQKTPVYLQHQFAAAAVRHGCAVELSALIGYPLPEPDPPRSRRYEPMF